MTTVRNDTPIEPATTAGPLPPSDPEPRTPPAEQPPRNRGGRPPGSKTRPDTPSKVAGVGPASAGGRPPVRVKRTESLAETFQAAAFGLVPFMPHTAVTIHAQSGKLAEAFAKWAETNKLVAKLITQATDGAGMLSVIAALAPIGMTGYRELSGRLPAMSPLEALATMAATDGDDEAAGMLSGLMGLFGQAVPPA